MRNGRANMDEETTIKNLKEEAFDLDLLMEETRKENKTTKEELEILNSLFPIKIKIAKLSGRKDTICGNFKKQEHKNGTILYYVDNNLVREEYNHGVQIIENGKIIAQYSSKRKIRRLNDYANINTN